MELLFVLLVLLFFLFLALVIVTIVGHWLWLFTAWFFKQLRGEESGFAETDLREACPQCGSILTLGVTTCFRCGWQKPTGIVTELLKDIAATERQLKRFHRTELIDEPTYQALRTHLDSERERLAHGKSRPEVPKTPPEPVPPPSVTEAQEEPIAEPVSPAVVAGSFIATEDAVIIEPVPTFFTEEASSAPPPFTAETKRTREPRRSFAEVFNAFMEESNIRWGEIVGGLLIIGCSTALVVSLWSEISQIPVLKFLIFTTVTAALFGVGLYTEHRWKLPTTSRGILTTATLLVPLNFLAIAAVSGGMTSGGAAIIASELVAPAVFLCLVYFAGKVLTPSWPHLLVAGVLGSSVGQLLIRHFASPDLSPTVLVTLGAVPMICYVAACVWMLRRAFFDSEARDSTAIFITIGALTFAAVLPFSLLLYKTGPVAMTMMYLAPLVSFGGFPALATGLLLWQRFAEREAVTTRTVGTALAILGTTIVVAGMLLAWPNPASIVPAALFSFAVFTLLAIVLELPAAHCLAGLCFALAYLVEFHVLRGHVAWLNLRETSLLSASLSVSSGLALAPLFIAFVAASEWFTKRRSDREGRAYIVTAALVGGISLLLTTGYGVWFWHGPFHLWFAYAACALGAFWIGLRRQWVLSTWAGSVLLLFSLAQVFALLQLQFPWQTALFTHATVCAAAVLFLQTQTSNAALLNPLRDSALAVSALAVITLVQAGKWETTGLQAQRLFWLAVIWLLLVWITRKAQLFILVQVALTLAIIVSIKATLQQYAWYAYLPHAFLHPWGLQIQGTVLVLLSLGWLGLRQLANSNSFGWIFSDDGRRLLNLRASVDRIVLWCVLVGFVLLAVYGALPGITSELTTATQGNSSWDIAGFPHQQVLELGSWILLALLVIAFLGTLWQRRRAVYLLGAVVALACVCPLIAGTWEANTATASAWRWCAALFLLIASMPLWFREQLKQPAHSVGWQRIDDPNLTRRVRELLLALTIVPVLLLTLYPAVRAVYYMPVHGPSAGLFAQLDPRLSYTLPLVLVALAVIGHGLRERIAEYVFASGLLFNCAVTIAYLLSVVAAQGSMNRVVVVQVLQLNAIVFALYALVWIAAVRYWSAEKLPSAKNFASVEVMLGVACNVLLALPATLLMVLEPERLSLGAMAIGSAIGWLALGLTIVAAVAYARVFEVHVFPLPLFVSLLGGSCLLACGFATNAGYENWVPAHVYLASVTASAWLLLFARNLNDQLSETPFRWIRFRSNWEQQSLSWAAVTGTFSLFLSLRLWRHDPSTEWWSIGSLLVLSVLFALLNWITFKRRFIYLAGVAFTAAAFIWTIVYYSSPEQVFVGIHVITLTLSSLVWLYLELRSRRLRQSDRKPALSFHNVAAFWALGLVTVMVMLRLLIRPVNGVFPAPGITDWLSLFSVALLLLAILWDQRARYAVAALYVAGLLILAQALDQLSLTWNSLVWAATLVVAAYLILTSLLWRKRKGLIENASSFGIPARIDPATTRLAWLVAFNLLLTAGVVLLSYIIVLNYPEGLRRITVALAVGLLCFMFAFLAEDQSRKNWQQASLGILVLGLVFLGWSFLEPDSTGTWFNRAVITMVEMFAVVAAYAAVQGKLELKGGWDRAIQTCLPWVAGAGVVALLFSLATEVFYQLEFGAVNIAPLALFAIGATLIAGMLICLLFALSPNHDPLKLSEQGRMGYVYAAEVMLALFFMHIRLSLPWLFTGFFERYWPLVVMVIAYLGVATSESLRRRKLLVLAQPLERTGVFLPLLPVLGFWLAQSEVDYSALLFLVGGLYALLSLLRRSFVFGLLAAIAGNGGLWYLWHRSADFQFLQHPQLWLIPVAVSVLIAVYLNEDDFTSEQMAGIRYLCLVTIYASSTADIFINGVAESPWLPLVLAALSLAGVFAGIVFRIRGFLLLGSVFLLLSIITMIWYASANLGWTWLWYVAGIVTGATIIFMFAVFEKKRSEVLRVVEGFKEWER